MFIYSSYCNYRFCNLYSDVGVGTFIVSIESNKIEKNQTNKYICRVISFNNDKKYDSTKLILYSNKTFKYGDVLQIYGNFKYASGARNFMGYNYRRVLWQEGIYGILESIDIEKISENSSLDVYLNKLKNNLEGNIENSIKDLEYAELLKGLLMGEKNNISDDTKTMFKKASLSHILAISGMHIGYILIIIKSLLAFINNKRLKEILSVAIMALFVIMIGAPPSSVRAFVMFILVICSKFFYRKSNSILNLFFALFIILCINPFYIENVGVWLSFGGTFGILEIYFRSYHRLKNKFWNLIFQNICISFSVQVFIFPIIVYNFNTISITFFISNFFISLFIGPIIFIGVIISIFKNFLYLANLESLLLHIIFSFSKFISNLAFSNIYVKTPNTIYVITYYIALFIFLHKRKFIKIFIKISLILLIVVNCISILLNSNEFQIHFLDVGQGDCALIKTKSNKTILIDGGEGGTEKFDQGENTVLPYLLDRGIVSLDYIIISHFDSDHVGGVFSIMENLKVKKVVISKQVELSENFEKFLEIVNERNIAIMLVGKGDSINIDKDVIIKFFWPNNLKLIKENGLNNNSIVCKVCYKNFSCLFTGDIEKLAEQRLLEEYRKNLECLNATVLKICHHGSETSSTSEFLRAVQPKIALIGVGEDNKFGHPSKDVVERLKERAIKIYRTDKMGEISIYVDSEGKIINIDKFIK